MATAQLPEHPSIETDRAKAKSPFINGRSPHSSVSNKEFEISEDAMICDIDLPLRKSFYPLGFAVDIVTNSDDVLVAATESFGHRRLRYGTTGLEIRVCVSPALSNDPLPLPARKAFGNLYAMMADPKNQAVIDLCTGANFVRIEERAIRDRLYLRQNFLEKVVYLLLGASFVTDIHAGCVSNESKGILLCGDSGAGKSTLAYGCARAGWTYVSDDTCYLINSATTPRVIGHSHRVRFRPEARELFQEIADYDITARMEGKPSIELPTSVLPVRSAAAEAAVHAIVYLKRNQTGHTEIYSLPEGSATRRLRAELFSVGDIRKQHEKNLSLLEKTPAFELHYRSLNDGIAELKRLADRL